MSSQNRIPITFTLKLNNVHRESVTHPPDFERALDAVNLDGRQTEYVNYVCIDCGYFETYITDKNALSKIPLKAKFNWNNILAVIIAVIAGTLPGSASSFFATFISIPLTGIK